ncbi:iron chaperone [Lacibacter sp. H407]|uniref:iron chaperone n=1 Tax=Lacibacter sp. H407 TaxID=3133423 RepID=UPI0030C37FB0
MLNASATNIDEYIAGFPAATQKLLEQIRAAIKKAAPSAEEAMKYGIPTFVLNGNLVHFAGYKAHIGFYPAPDGIKAFEKELSVYKSSKGAVQFPLDKPMPVALITKIVKFRVKQNLNKPVKKK